MGRHSKPVLWRGPAALAIVIATTSVSAANVFSPDEPNLTSNSNSITETTTAPTTLLVPEPFTEIDPVPTPAEDAPSTPSEGYSDLPPAEKDALRPSQGDTRASLTRSTTPPLPTTPPPSPRGRAEQPETSAGEPASESTSQSESQLVSVSNSRCTNTGVLDQVQLACNLVLNAIPEIVSVGGFAQRPNNPTSCHPQRLALDFMVDNNNLGDRVAKFVEDHQDELGATTILWEVEDHYDHVHVSFAPCTK